MKEFIRKKLLENLVKDSLKLSNINDIDDDVLYDSLTKQSEDLKNLGEIGFNGDLIFVIYDTNTNELAAASWLDLASGVYSPHFIVKPAYRGLKLYPELLNANIMKYKQMKQIRPNLIFLINTVNDDLAAVAPKYGFEPYNGLKDYFIYSR